MPTNLIKPADHHQRNRTSVIGYVYEDRKQYLQVQIRAVALYLQADLVGIVVQSVKNSDGGVKVGLRRCKLWYRQASCFLGLGYYGLHMDEREKFSRSLHRRCF